MKLVILSLFLYFPSVLQADSEPANLEFSEHVSLDERVLEFSDVSLDKLLVAIRNYQPERVRSIIESEKLDMSRFSLLVHSALDKPEVLEVLLEKGADTEVRNGHGNTPLYQIIDTKLRYNSYRGFYHTPSYQRPASREVLPNQVSENSWIRSLESVHVLLKYGADPNAGEGNSEYGRTPFLLAAFSVNHGPEIRKSFMSMLEHGGDVTDTRGFAGNTVLHSIAMRADMMSAIGKIELAEMAEALLNRGAKINALNERGETPLDLAKRLIERSISLKERNPRIFPGFDWRAINITMTRDELLSKPSLNSAFNDINITMTRDLLRVRGGKTGVELQANQRWLSCYDL